METRRAWLVSISSSTSYSSDCQWGSGGEYDDLSEALAFATDMARQMGIQRIHHCESEEVPFFAQEKTTERYRPRQRMHMFQSRFTTRYQEPIAVGTRTRTVYVKARF